MSTDVTYEQACQLLAEYDTEIVALIRETDQAAAHRYRYREGPEDLLSHTPQPVQAEHLAALKTVPDSEHASGLRASFSSLLKETKGKLKEWQGWKKRATSEELAREQLRLELLAELGLGIIGMPSLKDYDGKLIEHVTKLWAKQERIATSRRSERRKAAANQRAQEHNRDQVEDLHRQVLGRLYYDKPMRWFPSA